ncbi:unnamed protein product [Tetraodon nigroviridis]|uniref:(spotted green pufferfish) hypothetical protein n=1 Tax=Tetraodon nigroviridis TaxID=99883 RepID=Q4RYY8_TETNG|nr:unnamed protein product [Tetraodon nigroviridis]
MLSVMKTFTADKPLLVCLAHLLLILSLSGGSSLREHRLRGSEADSVRENPGRLTPNADMLKALQYIQSLHQRTSAQQHPSFPARFDAERMDDAEKLRRSTKQGGIRPHEKLPLMFEDEEEGARDEKEEGPDLEEESPFKRTNENVEEKYTPQNLATLQSVFDELDKLTGSRSLHKRHGEEDEAEEDEEEDADVFGVRDVAYDSAEGGSCRVGSAGRKGGEGGGGGR